MLDKQFNDIIALIQQSRAIAVKAVNTELINLYWNIGAYISTRIANANWGEKTIDELALFIQRNHPELKGFNRRGLYRMKQFYETYFSGVFVSPLVTQIQTTEDQSSKNTLTPAPRLKIRDISQSILAKISWSHHLYFTRDKLVDFYHQRIGISR